MPAENEREPLWRQTANRLSEMAEELGLSDEEKNDFVESGLERKGFKRVQTWADPEPEKEEPKGDFFAKTRANSPKKDAPKSGGSVGGWQYGG